MYIHTHYLYFSANRWMPPPAIWFKTNSEGTIFLPNGKANCNGILCDAQGAHLVAFSANRKMCSSVMVELCGTFHVFQLARHLCGE
jgi:hypothetical protein